MRRGVRLKYLKRIRRRGRVYTYVIAPGCKPVRLPNLPENDPDFLAAYAEARHQIAADSPARPQPGTIGAAITAYRASATWNELAAGTRATRDGILARIEAKVGKAAIAGLRQRHVRADIAELAANPANQRLKTWRALLRWCLDAGLVAEDPSVGIKARPVRTEGHHTWTPEEMAQARTRLPLGTKSRLALELAFWTGARRSDLVMLGHQNVGTDGWLTYRQQKTGTTVSIPFTAPFPELAVDQAPLLAALESFPTRLLFLETTYGRPHSVKGLGNWAKQHVTVPAGLPAHCTLHGLRKARATVLAELGWSSRRIASWLGHESISEGETYTKKADRRRILAGSS